MKRTDKNHNKDRFSKAQINNLLVFMEPWEMINLFDSFAIYIQIKSKHDW